MVCDNVAPPGRRESRRRPAPIPRGGWDAVQDDESEASHRRLAYLPALDGVRAFAVIAVMMFHGGFSFFTGGFMGVDAFFVLSGFLITSLLVGEWRQSLTIKLGAFWGRRARRLLPALLLMLLFVAFFASVIVPKGTYGALRLDALSTLLYVSNWHFILVGSNYFNETASASPLIHTWSLAVEEQFYLLWPLIVLGLLRLTKRLEPLFLLSSAAAVASAVWMYLLSRHAMSINRVYLGTDTRSQCLFIGCALAVGLVLLTQRGHSAGRLAQGELWRPAGARGHALCAVAGIVGAAVALTMWAVTDSTTTFPYSGGFFLVGLATAAVIVSAVGAPRSVVPRFLSLTPVRYVGQISYGIYIWHWPLFLWVDHARTGLSGAPLFFVRVLVTFAVSVASYHLVERPIRRGTFVRQWRAWVAVPSAVVVVLVATVAATTGTTAVSEHDVSGVRRDGSFVIPDDQPHHGLIRTGSPSTGPGVALRRLGGAHARARTGHSGGPGEVRVRARGQGVPRLRGVDGPGGRVARVARPDATGVQRVAGGPGCAPEQATLAGAVEGRHGLGQAERRRVAGRTLGGGRPRIPRHVDQHLEPEVRRVREEPAGVRLAVGDEHRGAPGVLDRAVHGRG